MNSLISESDESEVGGQQLVTNRKILKNCDDYNLLAIYIYLYTLLNLQVEAYESRTNSSQARIFKRAVAGGTEHDMTTHLQSRTSTWCRRPATLAAELAATLAPRQDGI